MKFLLFTNNFDIFYYFLGISNLIVHNNKLLVLSDNETDANTARRICSSSGGSLATITNHTTDDRLKQFLQRNLLPSGLIIN